MTETGNKVAPIDPHADLYAVVDKPGKNTMPNSNTAVPSGGSDPSAEMYAVVGKKEAKKELEYVEVEILPHKCSSNKVSADRKSNYAQVVISPKPNNESNREQLKEEDESNPDYENVIPGEPPRKSEDYHYRVITEYSSKKSDSFEIKVKVGDILQCKEEKDGLVFGIVILRAKGSKKKSQEGWVPTSHLERYMLAENRPETATQNGSTDKQKIHDANKDKHRKVSTEIQTKPADKKPDKQEKKSSDKDKVPDVKKGKHDKETSPNVSPIKDKTDATKEPTKPVLTSSSSDKVPETHLPSNGIPPTCTDQVKVSDGSPDNDKKEHLATAHFDQKFFREAVAIQSCTRHTPSVIFKPDNSTIPAIAAPTLKKIKYTKEKIPKPPSIFDTDEHVFVVSVDKRKSKEPDVLSFKKYELARLLYAHPSRWWLIRNTEGVTGWVPADFWRIMPENPKDDISPTDYAPWNFPHLSREESVKLLTQHGQEGTFLIRRSTHNADNQIIVSKHNDVVLNFQIETRNGDNSVYHIGGFTFTTVFNVILYYKKHPIVPGEKEPTGSLRKPLVIH